LSFKKKEKKNLLKSIVSLIKILFNTRTTDNRVKITDPVYIGIMHI